jgi:hypothetical protein
LNCAQIIFGESDGEFGIEQIFHDSKMPEKSFSSKPSAPARSTLNVSWRKQPARSGRTVTHPHHRDLSKEWVALLIRCSPFFSIFLAGVN